MSEQVTVVLPLYGNETQVGRLVGELAGAVPDRLSIVGVDDHSPDRSGAALTDAAARHGVPCQVIRNPTNRGQHASVVLGLRAVGAGPAVVMDADGQDPPEALARLLQPLEQGRASLVIGCRRAQGDDARARASRWFRRGVFRLAGVDAPAGVSAFWAADDAARQALFEHPDIDPRLLPLWLSALVPVSYCEYDRRERHAGTSTYSSSARLRYALAVLRQASALRRATRGL